MTQAIGADQIAKQIIEHSGQEGTGAAKPQQEAGIDDQNRMQEALRQQQINSEQSSQVQPTNTSPVQQHNPVTPSHPTLGDSILKGMDSVKNAVNAVGEKAQATTATQGSLSPQEILQNQLQTQVQLFHMEADTTLAAAVPNKLEQDADTLLKSS